MAWVGGDAYNLGSSGAAAAGSGAAGGASLLSGLAGPLIGAGASLLGGLFGSSAADDARRAQQAGAQNATNLQRQMYLASLGLQEPWRAVGQGSLTQLAQLFGLPYAQYQPASQIASGVATAGSGALLSAKSIASMIRSGKSVADIAKIGFLGGNVGNKQIRRLSQAGLTADQINQLQTGIAPQQAGQSNGLVTPAGPDMSVFQASPDYQFRRDEGIRDLGGSFAARGGAFSGNALRALTERNQNLANAEFSDFVNRRLRLAGLGSDAAGQQQQAGQNFANAGSQLAQNVGDARASGIANRTNFLLAGLGGAAQSLGGLYDQRGGFGGMTPWWRTPKTFPDFDERY